MLSFSHVPWCFPVSPILCETLSYGTVLQQSFLGSSTQTSDSLIANSLSQGGMDVQYLSARFQKGRKWVAELMEKQHRYMNLRSHSGGLSDAHAELLRYQAAAGDGGNASLDFNIRTVVQQIKCLHDFNSNLKPQDDNYDLGFICVAIAWLGLFYNHWPL